MKKAQLIEDLKVYSVGIIGGLVIILVTLVFAYYAFGSSLLVFASL